MSPAGALCPQASWGPSGAGQAAWGLQEAVLLEVLPSQGSCRSFNPELLGLPQAGPGLLSPGMHQLSIMQEEEPGRFPILLCQAPDPPLHFLSLLCMQARARPLPPPSQSNQRPCPGRAPTCGLGYSCSSWLRQGVRLLLPPGHHLGEHSRVSCWRDQEGLQGAGVGDAGRLGQPWHTAALLAVWG